MKQLITTVTVIICAVMLLAVMPTESEAEIYEDTLRLHILANSDSTHDQEIKLEIRDRILKKYSKELSSYGSIDEAKTRMTELLADVKRDVDSWLYEMGEEHECEVMLGEEWYDTREYEEFTLPKGYYSSLRVIIGEGDGRNWWCVMFPPKCLDIATENAPPDDGIVDYTKEEIKLITSKGYNVKFKLLELISDAARKLSKKG